MKTNLYFTRYDARNDVYVIESSFNYIKDSFNNYILHGGVFTKNMVYNTLKEASKALTPTSKIIKYINIKSMEV